MAGWSHFIRLASVCPNAVRTAAFRSRLNLASKTAATRPRRRPSPARRRCGAGDRLTVLPAARVASTLDADPSGEAIRAGRSGLRLLSGSELQAASAFAAMALRYWPTIYPSVARELSCWRERAAQIADPLLRGIAEAALEKRGNMEGAALFAV